MYAMRPDIRKLLDTAKAIEGLARNAGTHAAGVVISAGPLIDYAPLVRFNDGGVNTQFDMEWVEKIGLLKMDFLGLRNLTVMDRAVKEIRRTVDGTFDLAKIPIEDRKTYDMLGHGDTMGVFQLESEGMKRVCTELKPSRFEDIIALVALYRPGPMDWIPQYIAIKHGRAKPKYLHPKLEPILAETYRSPATKNRSCRSRATSPVLRWAKPTNCARSWGRSRRTRFRSTKRSSSRERSRRRRLRRSSRRRSLRSSSRSRDTASTSRTRPRTD